MEHYNTQDTIVSIASPPGNSAIGIIRLSGPGTFKLVDIIFSKPTRQMEADRQYHGWINDENGDALDEAVIALMKNPKSFTGDDSCEIYAHGGWIALNVILRLLLRLGARQALPGEYSFRAFANGKMDLTKAESVAALIASKTELAHKNAVKHLKGIYKDNIDTLKRALIDLLSRLEASLDYAEDDIKFIAQPEVIHKLESAVNSIDELIGSAKKGLYLENGFRVTITGKPNAGKSMLLNTLVKKDRAIVTDIPGTTRDVLEETLDIKGLPVIIMDTAGIREHTTDKVEMIGQGKTFECLKDSDLILFVLDAGLPLDSADRFLYGKISALGLSSKILFLLNKIDLPSTFGQADIRAFFDSKNDILPICAVNGSGLKGLEERIFSFSGLNNIDSTKPLVISLRHEYALIDCKKSLLEAMSTAGRGESEEITAHHLRSALDAIGRITGETTTEEILSSIFANFCVGK